MLTYELHWHSLQGSVYSNTLVINAEAVFEINTFEIIATCPTGHDNELIQYQLIANNTITPS